MKYIKQIVFNIIIINICPHFSLTAVNDQLSNPMNASYLFEIIRTLESGQNIIFTKYGDGEFNCMSGANGTNCDSDSYHSWLGESLKKALVNLCNKKNVYIGKWWTTEVSEFCNHIAHNAGTNVPWTWYHLFMNDDIFFKFDYMYQFVKFIINTKRKKIIVSNSKNSKLKEFFNADVYVEIPPRNWSFEYSKWKNEISKYIEKDSILLISGGLCSKVLIDDITTENNVTCIDLGSSFDLLATGQKSRAWQHSYEEEVAYYQDFLPKDW